MIGKHAQTQERNFVTLYSLRPELSCYKIVNIHPKNAIHMQNPWLNNPLDHLLDRDQRKTFKFPPVLKCSRRAFVLPEAITDDPLYAQNGSIPAKQYSSSNRARHCDLRATCPRTWQRSHYNKLQPRLMIGIREASRRKEQAEAELCQAQIKLGIA